MAKYATAKRVDSPEPIPVNAANSYNVADSDKILYVNANQD